MVLGVFPGARDRAWHGVRKGWGVRGERQAAVAEPAAVVKRVEEDGLEAFGKAAHCSRKERGLAKALPDGVFEDRAGELGVVES